MIDPVQNTEYPAQGIANGPWGGMSQMMADLCQIGVHFVWSVRLLTKTVLGCAVLDEPLTSTYMRTWIHECTLNHLTY